MGEVTREEADNIADRRRQALDKALSEARNEQYHPSCQLLKGIWSGYYGGPSKAVPLTNTRYPKDMLVDLLHRLTRLPKGFQPHKKLKKWLDLRRQMAEGEKPIDWATAEALAFATLAVEGMRVRMSGQDSCRGTFSQRHAILHDSEDGTPYMPLQHLSDEQAPVEIINSPLSEMGVMGFEYGYSLDTPDGLVLWEAQFGDFCNAAQVIIDQFITSAEDKWQRLNGLVLLLPHGFEGQGPEHSSARLERWLMLSAEDNIQVAYPTTPAQYYHLLRRQVLRRWRKPLVVMTPKSLLRSPQATSTLDELADNLFQKIILDDQVTEKKPRGVVLCTGKVYYDLVAYREEHARNDVPIVRFEQLYPVRDEEIEQQLGRYPDGTPFYWVQEEPENMGAWPYLRMRFGDTVLGRWPLSCVSRHASASPATGSAASHKLEQRRLVEEACGKVCNG
jgi:2-oxoglutarate dehydrogenase E1 component